MNSRLQIITETLLNLLEGAKERSQMRLQNAEFFLRGKGPKPRTPAESAQILNIIGMAVRQSEARREEAKKLRGMRSGEIPMGSFTAQTTPEKGKQFAQDYLSRVRY